MSDLLRAPTEPPPGSPDRDSSGPCHLSMFVRGLSVTEITRYPMAGPVPWGANRGAPTSGCWWGPPEKNDVKSLFYVIDLSKNRKIFGALRAHIVTFLYFCRRRAPTFLGLAIWTEY